MSKAFDAARLNMEETVAQAKDALVHMKLAPSSFFKAPSILLLR
jgi:hypothetical protein